MKIKKKVISRNKIPSRNDLEKITIQAAEYANDIQMAIERRFRIIQLDECVVTKNTIPKTAWSLKKMNIELDFKELNMDPLAIIAAVSREYGVDHVMVFKRSINKDKFKIFL